MRGFINATEFHHPEDFSVKMLLFKLLIQNYLFGEDHKEELNEQHDFFFAQTFFLHAHG